MSEHPLAAMEIWEWAQVPEEITRDYAEELLRQQAKSGLFDYDATLDDIDPEDRLNLKIEAECTALWMLDRFRRWKEES